MAVSQPTAHALRVLGLVILGLAAVAIVGVVAYRGQYNEWPGQNLPELLSLRGRDYHQAAAGPLNPSLVRLDRFDPPFDPGHDVLGSTRLCAERAGGACDTIIYLRDGKKVVGYVLSGGP